MNHHTNAKVQHYVPQFLLRNFGVGKKNSIHVFDKQTGKAFRTIPRNVAAESRYYDFEVNGVRSSAEPDLARLEERAAQIIKKILHTKNVQSLCDEERFLLAVFCAVQMTRTRASRESSRSLRDTLVGFVRASVEDDRDRLHVEEYTSTLQTGMGREGPVAISMVTGVDDYAGAARTAPRDSADRPRPPAGTKEGRWAGVPGGDGRCAVVPSGSRRREGGGRARPRHAASDGGLAQSMNVTMRAEA